jgi:SnoaL-like domain
MHTEPITDLNTLAKRYIDAWNETDAPARRALINELYTDDAGYTDPLARASGRDQIDATIAAVQQQFAGLVFSLAGSVDSHHDTARFQWHLGAPGADEPLVVGFDVVVAENGRLRQVYGFLDKVPTA